MSAVNLATLAEIGSGISVAIPYITAILTQKHYPSWVNEIVALVVSLVGGTITFLAGGGHFVLHDLGALVASLAGVFTASKVYYAKLGIHSPLIDFIESITGPKGQPLPDTATDAPDTGAGS